ncbi:endonuclease/exonuclease/phosphatase family protein [Pseudonocardia ailaonensis]|uniref:endonuclease/exonuclease/phosphatase family protein n=1 Tax=Pseudonocardia ailaonensis TaxID=367279 RepID=UPI0031CF5361
MQISVGSWNIGGAILGKSHQRNGQPSLHYYIDLIEAERPDILCLQEAHEFVDGTPGQAIQIAKAAGFAHCVSQRLSRSHLADDAWLSIATLSRFPISDTRFRLFPRFELEAVGPDFRPWKLHDKGYIVSRVQLEGDIELDVLNAHCFPLHRFRTAATKASFRPVWQMLRNELFGLSQRNSVAAMDLNYPEPETLLGDSLGEGSFSLAFRSPTKPSGAQHDFILSSESLKIIGDRVLPTRSDHSYCMADFQIRNARSAAS